MGALRFDYKGSPPTDGGLKGGDRLIGPLRLCAALLESFVFSEVLKLMSASDLQLTPFHFRDQQMREVDIVLERDDGMIAGIEIKASATVKSSDFGGLRTLTETCGNRFACGVVLYDGADVVPFGDRLAAVAVQKSRSSCNRHDFMALWQRSIAVQKSRSSCNNVVIWSMPGRA